MLIHVHEPIPINNTHIPEDGVSVGVTVGTWVETIIGEVEVSAIADDDGVTDEDETCVDTEVSTEIGDGITDEDETCIDTDISIEDEVGITDAVGASVIDRISAEVDTCTEVEDEVELDGETTVEVSAFVEVVSVSTGASFEGEIVSVEIGIEITDEVGAFVEVVISVEVETCVEVGVSVETGVSVGIELKIEGEIVEVGAFVEIGISVDLEVETCVEVVGVSVVTGALVEEIGTGVGITDEDATCDDVTITGTFTAGVGFTTEVTVSWVTILLVADGVAKMSWLVVVFCSSTRIRLGVMTVSKTWSSEIGAGRTLKGKV